MVNSSRKRAIQIAREYLAMEPIFLDTETTGLDTRSEIVEISLVNYSGEVLFDSLVKPYSPIPIEAFQIHGISNEMVKDSPNWADVWSLVAYNLEGRYIGIYNADFDLRMMKQSHQRYGINWDYPGLANRMFDVMKLFLDYSGNHRWVTLDSAARQVGILGANLHRSREDSLLCRDIFIHIATRIP